MVQCRHHWLRGSHLSTTVIGNQSPPILLKKGTLGSGPHTHTMPVGLDSECILELLGLDYFNKYCEMSATECGHISTLRRPGDTYDLKHELGKLPTNLGQMNGQMNGQHTPLLQSSSLEDSGSPETPFSLPNTECRVLGGKHEDLGILGTREVLDAWHWPEALAHSLFTTSRRGNRKVNRGKDIMASALRDVWMTCRISCIPDARDLWIKHCSGRPRCIHELKQH